MDGTCSTHRNVRNAYKILIRKPKRKRPRGTHANKREDNIRMDGSLRTGREVVYVIYQAQNRDQ
jgi:hypothetical protein